MSGFRCFLRLFRISPLRAVEIGAGVKEWAEFIAKKENIPFYDALNKATRLFRGVVDQAIADFYIKEKDEVSPLLVIGLFISNTMLTERFPDFVMFADYFEEASNNWGE